MRRPPAAHVRDESLPLLFLLLLRRISDNRKEIENSIDITYGPILSNVLCIHSGTVRCCPIYSVRFDIEWHVPTLCGTFRHCQANYDDNDAVITVRFDE